METIEVKIEICDKRKKATSTIYVEQLADNKFKMIDNDIFNCKLTLGTEFETRINREGKHEIIKIIKTSDFVTRRFFLSPNYKESDYSNRLKTKLMKKRAKLKLFCAAQRSKCA